MSDLSSPLACDLPRCTEQLAHLNAPLTLTRIIQGLSFKHPASVVSLDAETAVFQTAEIQLYTCLEGSCLVRSQALPRPIGAGLVNRNLARRQVVLSHFACFSTDWIERYQDRAQPRSPASVGLESDRMALSAALVDVNPFGMGVLVRKRLAEASNLHVSSRLELDFQLNSKARRKRLSGMIVHLEPVGSLLMRAGIQFRSTAKHANELQDYVAQRREEIVAEFDDLYWRALEPRRVEDLYF